MKVRYRAAAGLAVLAMAVAACGGGGGSDAKKPSAEQSQQAQQQAAALPEVAINETPYEQVPDGGTVKLALQSWQTQWNYNQTQGTKGDVRDAIYPMMPFISISDEKGQVTNNPDYVSEWKSEVVDGKQTVTYKINEKATWSDGEPIGFADFEAMWKALNGKNKDYLISSPDGYDRIESVEKGATDKDVIVKFSKVWPAWQGLFSPLFPASINKTAEGFNKGYLNKIPVTAGPFKLGKIDQTAKTVTAVRDDKWWGRKAKLDSVVFRAIDLSGHVPAFANGEIDAVVIGADGAKYQQAKDVAGSDLRKAAGPIWRHFTFNGASEALKDKNVRHAIFMGINRTPILQSDLQGLDWPMQPQDNHVYVNTQKGYQDNSGGLNTYNPDKAKQLLDAAGWKLEGDVRKKDGKELNIRFMYSADLAVAKQEGELTQAMLKEIGVKVTLDAAVPDKFFDRINEGDFDVTPFVWEGTPFPLGNLFQLYGNPPDSKLFNNNFTRVGSAELDAAMDAAASEIDPAKAVELGNKVDQLIWDQAGVLPLFQRPNIVAAKAGLANYGAFGFSDRDWTAVGLKK
ncbi:ABC transporter family substrate-binding protein [Nonomuraea endophytica]|uniref:ABC transporter family substrate-binding protein n=1 Tax=Nonomuraea endophytica TaxID=714136 RepID=UPI0037CACF98